MPAPKPKTARPKPPAREAPASRFFRFIVQTPYLRRHLCVDLVGYRDCEAADAGTPRDRVLLDGRLTVNGDHGVLVIEKARESFDALRNDRVRYQKAIDLERVYSLHLSTQPSLG